MKILLWVIIITFIAGVGGTGLGGAVASLFSKDSEKEVSLLLSFAGGVMLSVVCFDLIVDAINSGVGSSSEKLYIVIGGILLGYGVIFLLNHIIDNRANRKSRNTYTELQNTVTSKPRLFIAGVVMAAAIALHNFPEGMVIGASFVETAGSQFISKNGILLAIVIGLHNIPEGMAVSAPLISGGMKKSRAILITSLSGSPTIIGALVGYCIGSLSDLGLAVSLSFASGAMLYVVFGELLPESILIWRSKMPAFVTLIGVIVGMLIIFA